MNTDEAWESFMSIRKASSKGYADTIAAALNDIKTDTAKLTKLTNRLLGDQGMLESSAGTAPTDDLGGAPGGDMTGGMELPDNTEERGALDDAMDMLGDKAGAGAPQAAAAADMDAAAADMGAAQADQDMAAADVGDAVADMDVSAADQTLPETGAGMTPDQALPQPEATFETACVQFSETVKQELQKAASEGDYYKARRLIEIVTAIDKIVESDGNPDTVLKGEESTDNEEVSSENVGEPSPGTTPGETPGETPSVVPEEMPENEKVKKSCSEESIDKAIHIGDDPKADARTGKFLERHGIRGSNIDEDVKIHGRTYGTREEVDDDDDGKDIKKSEEKGEYESADPITDGTGKRGSPRPGEEAETAHADPIEVSKTTSSEGTREAEGFANVDMTKNAEADDDDIGKTDDGAPVADEGMTGSVEGDNVASSCKKSASMPSFKDLMASRQSEGSEDLYSSFMKSVTDELQSEMDSDESFQKSVSERPASFSELMAKHRKTQRGLREGC